MGKIKLLDCTLRDGGYINNWAFGEREIPEMIQKLEEAKVDILEVGFLKDEPYQTDRTVFNNMAQISALIAPKKKGIDYAAMIEVVNPIPLEMLAPRSEDTVDIIRVIVWKTKHTASGEEVDALEEGFQYCRGIVEKGYRLCVQPARVDQYSDEEFIAMVKKFSTLNPLAVYVVDSWGTQRSEQIIHYVQLADQHLPHEIQIGYHGHNNMMQALDAAQCFIKMGLERDIIIDASVYGIGRGAGNLNTELIGDYLNDQCGGDYAISPLFYVYDHYVKPIYDREPWGYTAAYDITAKANCNPNYGRFYDFKLHLPAHEIEEIIRTIPVQDKVMYTDNLAMAYFKKYRRNRWKHKLAIIIPTANRPQAIQSYLEAKSEEYSKFGIDLIIFDSSDDDQTKRIAKRYEKMDSSTVIYRRYTGEFDGVSIDKKVIAAYQMFVDQYDYLWACRDGHLINIWNVGFSLEKLMENAPDAIIVYDHVQNDKGFQNGQRYTDPVKILKHHCCHMAILGATVFSSQFIRQVIEAVPVDLQKNYGLWQPMAMFEYWADHAPKVYLYVGSIFSINKFATPSSFWNKKGKALWQWGQRWYEMVTNLPVCYDPVKQDIMHIGMADFTPFQPRQLIIMRANGSLNLKLYSRYKRYLDCVSTIAPWKFQMISFVPRWVCSTYLKDQESFFGKTIRFVYKGIRHLYHKWGNSGQIPSVIPPNFEFGTYQMEKNSALKHIVFPEKKLCIVIPTYNSPDIIHGYLSSAAEYYASFGIDVIIYDSSENDETAQVVSKWQKIVGERLHFNKVQMTDMNSMDQKVMQAYKTYASQYEYVWVVRNRSGILLNNCAVNLLNAMKKKPDMIVVANTWESPNKKENAVYKDCKKLFEEQFNPMTVLGGTIVKGSFIQAVMEQEPLDMVKNYGLWQPIAFFHYISDKPFLAISITGHIFQYHADALKGSFWLKNLMYQWVERFYVMLDELPVIYKDSLYQILLDWTNQYHLLEPIYIMQARLRGGIKPEEVENCKQILPYVSVTPLECYEKISRMSKRQIRYTLRHYQSAAVREPFMKTDYSKLGDFPK